MGRYIFVKRKLLFFKGIIDILVTNDVSIINNLIVTENQNYFQIVDPFFLLGPNNKNMLIIFVGCTWL